MAVRYFFYPYETVNFTSNLTGEAFDSNGQAMDVSLLITGKAESNMYNTYSLFIRGGSVKIEGIGIFSISSGSGSLTRSSDLVLNLKVAEQYGGGQTNWHLNGEITSANQKVFTVELAASSVPLPISGHPVLEDLTLNGKVVLK